MEESKKCFDWRTEQGFIYWSSGQIDEVEEGGISENLLQLRKKNIPDWGKIQKISKKSSLNSEVWLWKIRKVHLLHTNAMPGASAKLIVTLKQTKRIIPIHSIDELIPEHIRRNWSNIELITPWSHIF